MKYLFILLLVITGCTTVAKKEIAVAGALVPYDEKADPMPHHTRDIKDIVTPDGWKIAYFVKNDSTKNKDLYIQWSKGAVKRTYCGYGLLYLQSYFTPVFKTETNSYIFLEHEVRGGGALLILPKNDTTQEKIFSYVVGYSVEHARVAYIPESSHLTDSLDAEVYDLKSGKIKSVRFKKPCAVTPEGSCIIKAEFDGKQVMILGSNDGGKDATEIKTITF